MPLPYTLLIDPLPAEADAIPASDTIVGAATDTAGTFREVAADAPALRVGELSTQRGDGIFETIAVVDGHAQEAEAHLSRLEHSAEICELPAPNIAQWRAAIMQALANVPDTGELAMKLVLSRGVEHGPAPTAWLHVTKAADFHEVRTTGIKVVTLDRGYARGTAERAPWLLMGAKTLSYAVNMAATREAVRRGAHDAIFLTSDGYVMEGPTSSVIARFGDAFVTPAPSGAILHGTTQISLFDHLALGGHKVSERDLTLAELHRADALWLVSSVRLAVAVTQLDGDQFPHDLELTARFNEYLLSPRD